MKLSLGARLTLSYLIVILISLGIVVPLAWLAVERQYINTQRENLLAQAKLVAATLGSEVLPASSAGPYTQTTNVLPGIHTRIIDPLGAVVIDLTAFEPTLETAALALPKLAQNAAGQVTPEELVSRPEIAQSRLGEPTTAIRRVEVAGGRRVLYAAAPVLSADGSVLQIVYLATPLPDTQWSAFPILVRVQFVIVILAAIFIASLAGLLFAWRISRPLEKLAGAAHAVAEGDLSQTVPEDKNITELTILGGVFNTMTTNLRRADQTKTAFISDVSHELRTPLTVIKGTIETLQDGALNDRQGRELLLASMSRETERLIKLVNDLLVLTRFDAGALNLQIAKVDMVELTRSRCAHFEQTAGQRQVHLHTADDPKSSGENVSVMGDPDRLAQVLDNLLDNAMRYSPPGGEVTVTLTREADQVACRVIDRGPGIPAEHLPYIFERFYRADSARGRDDGGSGLGLAIVSSLVQAHGGHVTASSIEGQGTTMTFWLPAKEVT